MTEVQEKLIELLNEIDELCSKNDLHYFLANEAALSAYRSQKFESDATKLTIFMPYTDGIKLQKIISSQNRKDRCIDSIIDNPDYPNLSMSYSNLNTIHIDLNNNYGLKAIGISVYIVLLRKNFHGLLKYFPMLLESGWIYNYPDFVSPIISRKRKFIKYTTGFLMKISKNLYRKMMISMLNMTQKNLSLKDSLYVKPMKGKRIYYPSHLFSETQLVTFEGHQYPIPKDASKYFSRMFGLRWMNKTFSSKEVTASTIVDPRLPVSVYLEYLNQNGIQLHSQEHKRKERAVRQSLGKANQAIDRAWKYVLRTGARFQMWELYMPKKEMIKTLYEKKDWMSLKELFKEYDEVVQKNYHARLGVCFDKEIFDIYLATLKHDGEKEFAEALSELVPEQHLKPIKIND